MNELLRYLILFGLIILNQIFLASGIWSITPDIFVIQTLVMTTFIKKIPNVYFFIFKGFLIDLFFSNVTMPYTITFGVIGLYLNFSNLKWIQRSLLEQIILIFFISFILNIMLFLTNDYAEGMSSRIIINPLLNSIAWSFIFINQRQKWLKNI
jgi:rod shape-determining protein MreD|tara:strand:- start:7792 stop:8250 length:459 start_codon:yes stop_codon:yes gene_type:complete